MRRIIGTIYKKAVTKLGIILETKRLLLRPLTLDDAEEAYRNWTSDPEVARFMRWEVHDSPAVTRAWLVADAQDEKTHNFGFVRKDTGALIGCGGLCWSKDHGMYELGYNIMKSCWNQGYTTEAAQALVVYARDELHQKRLFCCHAVDNPASGRVMKKAGFVYQRDGSYTNFDGTRHFACREYLLEF